MPAGRSYTTEEDNFIRSHYNSMLYRDIALRLGRSKSAISHRIRKLGLSKKSLRRWTQAEDEIIRGNIQANLDETAKMLDRHPSEVSMRAKKLDVPFRTRDKRIVKDGYECRRWTDTNGKRRYSWIHREIMEQSLGRTLIGNELVHHVNGIKGDNRINNLFLCHNKSHHKLVHTSLERLLPRLLERGYIRFNRTEGIYELCETSE